MALSNEDKKDVRGAMGAKMANKVSEVTRDSKSHTKKKELAKKVSFSQAKKIKTDKHGNTVPASRAQVDKLMAPFHHK